MKKKIISLFLACFMFLSSSLTCFAENKNVKLIDGGVITVPMLATLVTLAVGTGIVITNEDDIVDLGRMFYDKNKKDWTAVNTLFEVSVAIGKDKIVSVGQDFLNLCTDFFDDYFSNNKGEVKFIDSLPIYPTFISSYGKKITFGNTGFSINNVGEYCYVYHTSKTSPIFYPESHGPISFYLDSNSRVTLYFLNAYGEISYSGTPVTHNLLYSSATYSIPYTGTYDKNKVTERVKEGTVAVPVPNNLGNLVGQNVDVWNPTYDLPIGGIVTVPVVGNPSIDVELDSVFVEDVVVDDDDVIDEDKGENNPSLPSFPNFGDALDFSPFELIGITDKFPFSLAWDLGRVIKVFDVEPKPPIFKVPIVSEEITIDLTEFNEWAEIIRYFVITTFVCTLIFLTSRFKG